MAAVGIAVAATAAAVAVPILAATDRSPVSSGAADVLQYTFDVDAAGWVERDRSQFSNFEKVWLEDRGRAMCTVHVMRPGAFDTDRIPPGSERLTVRGNPGYYALVTGELVTSAMDPGVAGPSPTPGRHSPIVPPCAGTPNGWRGR